jgi:hypothetical protein
MAKKEIRGEINDITRELMDIKEELGHRFSELKKIIKPAGLVLAGYIGLKIMYKILRMILGLLWRNMLVIVAILILVFVGYNQVQTGKDKGPG